jgi:uncharacterized protein involved in exopolysaccharide biosynthesis
VRETNTQIRPETERNTEYSAPEVVETNGGTSNSWLYVWMVWEQRSFIFRCAMFGAVASLILAFLLPKEYEATTQLMPPDGDGLSAMSMMASKVSALAENPMIGKFASEALGGKTPGALFVGVLQSRTVQDRIIDKFDLRREYWVSHYDSARKKLTNKTAISEDRKSGIITLSVTDRDPLRAAAMAQEYVSQLNVLMSQLTTSRAHRERVFLEERLNVAKQELDSASRDLGEFSSKNATIDLKDEGKAIVDSAAILQGQLIVAQSEVKGLEQIYTSNNVRVKSLHARIAELERKLNEMGGSKGISVGSPGQHNNAVGDDAAGTKDDFLYPSLRQLPILGERYSDLYLRAKIAERVYELLTGQYEMARVEEAKEIPSVRALDLAVPPERRSWPPRTVIIVSGALLFGVGGGIWILGQREWDNLDPADPRKVFAFEVGAVTAQGLASSRVVSYFRRRNRAFLNSRQKTD